MAQINSVFIQAYVTREPETKFVGNAGTQLTTFTVCHVRNYQRDGEWQKDSTFLDCKCWGTTAERASQLHKGDEIVAAGRITQEKWTTSDGAARSKLVLVCDKLDMVGQPRPRASAPAPATHDDELPF